MNSTIQSQCNCSACSGADCTCGCRSPQAQSTGQQACACGPQCQCGPQCACSKVGA